jgi:hypothetical protein
VDQQDVHWIRDEQAAAERDDQRRQKRTAPIVASPARDRSMPIATILHDRDARRLGENRVLGRGAGRHPFLDQRPGGQRVAGHIGERECDRRRPDIAESTVSAETDFIRGMRWLLFRRMSRITRERLGTISTAQPTRKRGWR